MVLSSALLQPFHVAFPREKTKIVDLDPMLLHWLSGLADFKVMAALISLNISIVYVIKIPILQKNAQQSSFCFLQ